jgi:hypothetical protein
MHVVIVYTTSSTMLAKPCFCDSKICIVLLHTFKQYVKVSVFALKSGALHCMNDIVALLIRTIHAMTHITMHGHRAAVQTTELKQALAAERTRFTSEVWYAFVHRVYASNIQSKCITCIMLYARCLLPTSLNVML